MSIPFTCPHCKQSFKAKDDFAGKFVRCPNADCKKTVLVPANAPARAPVGPGQDTPAPQKAVAPPPPPPAAGSGPRPAVRANGGPPAKPAGNSGAAPAVPPAAGNGSASTRPANAGSATTRPDAPAKPPAKPTTRPPAAPPGPSAEELAAALLSQDELKPVAPEAAPTFLKTTCPACDHTYDVAANLAGKNTLCPECKHRFRVPLPKEEKPKDWRTAGNDKPSLARRDQEQLEGAWGATEVKVVGRDAIRAVGAVEEEEPLTWSERLVQVGKWGSLAAVVLVAGWFGWAWWSASATGGVMQRAIAFVADPKNPAKLSAVQKSALYRLAGDFEVRQGRPQKALESYQKARAPLPSVGTPERDLLVAELAEGTAGLFGADVRPPDGSPVTWSWDGEFVQKNLRQTLDRLKDPGVTPEVRSETVRRVTRRLAKTPALSRWLELAPGLAGNAEERAEVRALAGLELFSAGVKDKAKELADAGLRDLAEAVAGEGTPRPLPGAPRLLALLVALDYPAADRGRLAPEPGPLQTPVTRAGYTEGWARAGKLDEARAMAAAPSPGVGPTAEANLRATSQADLLDAVLAAGGKAEDDVKATEEVVKASPRGAVAAATLYRLARLVGRAGDPDRAKVLAGLVFEERPDAKRAAAEWRAAAQLEALRARLDKALAARQKAEPAWAEDVDWAESLARSLAVAAVAAHNGELGDTNASRVAAALQPDSFKPFGIAGVALALQPGQAH